MVVYLTMMENVPVGVFSTLEQAQAAAQVHGESFEPLEWKEVRLSRPGREVMYETETERGWKYYVTPYRVDHPRWMGDGA